MARHSKAKTPIPIEGDTPAGEVPPSLQLQEESRDLLLQVWGQMSADCRELWGMIAAGLSYREMSTLKGVAEGTLRVRVLRCREKAAALREELRAQRAELRDAELEVLTAYPAAVSTSEIERVWEVFDPGARLLELIEAMLPQSVPTPAMVLQARRNSVSRAALIEEFGLLTGGQIAEINESAAENRAALASRWKQERKIFSVMHHGATYYPAFQFAPSGRPRPVISRILEALGGGDGWETALWFAAANGYLGAARPVDLLDTDPDSVAEAAKKDVEVPY